MAVPVTKVAPSYITLPHKSPAKLAYNFFPAKDSSNLISAKSHQPLLVFLNGLGLPAASWSPTIALLSEQARTPAMLTYDRFGQGATTDRDPLDTSAEDPMHGHTVMDVVVDLHYLIAAIKSEHSLNTNLPIALIGNSIGCAVARLYAETYPNIIIGLILLDSVLANSDFVSIFPDPDVLNASNTMLPEGVTAESLREARGKMGKIFHPSNGSREGLSRKNLAALLPRSDGPLLVYEHTERQSSKYDGPWITVVGHGFDAFANESFGMFGVPHALTHAYSNPYWHTYNVDLTKTTNPDRARGPVLAEKSGHFIQKDDPGLVAREILGMLAKISA